ncbi:MAG: tRNA (adenosine(37)-N6)-dimethylallyltransferase MiaA [bacterium]
MSTHPLVIILGPTASGKSSLAVKLAKQLDGEIISADSRQIYKGMDIGTGKITKQDMEDVPHHLLDITTPDKVITLAEWQTLAKEKIKEITNRNKLPLLAGGTGLYLSSIINWYDIPAHDLDHVLRKELEQLPLQELQQRLKAKDPSSYQQLDINNPRRIIRALEYNLLTGKSFIEEQKKHPCPYELIIIGLAVDPTELQQRIDKRINQMFNKGLIQEVEGLLKQYPKNSPAFSGIGYKETIALLDKQLTFPEAIKNTALATRRYAKRQMTWFNNKIENINWITESFEGKSSEIIKQLTR